MDISTIKLPPQVQVLRSAADKPELATMDAATKKMSWARMGHSNRLALQVVRLQQKPATKRQLASLQVPVAAHRCRQFRPYLND